jgi:short-subunit dehydrogenase
MNFLRNKSTFQLHVSHSMASHARETFALITGASSGIGKAIAEELARKNINLILVALPETGLEDVAHQLAEQNKIVVYSFCTDLTDAASPYQLAEACRKENIDISILVNNAGFGNLELFENSDLTELLQMMRLNNQALVALTYLFIPFLKKNKQAYVMNLGSLASVFKIPYKAVYSATKSFVFSFSAALRLELNRHNISVSCLCPGSTFTSVRVKDILKRTSGKNSAFVQSPEAVAKTAVKGMFARQFKIVPGLHNRALLSVNKLLPEAITDRLLVKLFTPTTEGKPMVLSLKDRSVGWNALGLANR